MASFVEQATLKVNDQSTKQIRQINRALKDLMRTARSARRIPIGLNLGRTQSQITSLKRQLNSLGSKRTQINISTAQASRNLRNLNAQIRALQNRTININARTRLPAPPGGGGRNAAPAGRQRVVLDFGSFRHFVTGEMYGVIRNAIMDGFKAASDLEVANTRIALQQLPAAQRAAAGRAGAGIAADYPVMTRGQATGLVAETLPMAGGDVAIATAITRELATMIELQVAQGESIEAATQAALNFAKAAEQSGRVYDRQGKFDPAALGDTFMLFRQMGAQIGKEFSGEFVRNAIKYLQTSKYGADNRMLAATLLLNEENGTSASVGLNQAIAQLSGTRIQKKQLARLRALGLIETAEVPAGSTDDGITFNELVGAGAVDESTLRSNLLQWVNEKLMPAAVKAGVDLNDPTQISKFASAITSDRTAINAVSTILVRYNDLMRQIDNALGNDLTTEKTRGIANESLLVGLQELQSGFSNIIAEVTNSFRSVLLPAMDATATAFNSLASFIAGPDGEGSPGRALGVAAGAGVGVLGAGAIGRSILSSLFNPLNQSAAALNGAAAALTAAATRLGGAGVVGGAGAAGAAAGGAGMASFFPAFIRVLGAAGLFGLVQGQLEAQRNRVVGEMEGGSYVGSLAGEKRKGDRVGEGAFGVMQDPAQAVFALDAALAGGIMQMDNTFSQGTTDIGGAFSTGGSMASEQMLQAIISGGQQAAAAIGAAINNAQVRVAPQPSTGAMNVTSQ